MSDQNVTDLFTAAVKGLEAPLSEVLARPNGGKQLIERARDDHQRTVLHILALHGHHTCIERVLSFDADVLNTPDDKGQSPLHSLGCCPAEEVRAASMLIRAGSSGNMRDNHGRTPLHLCIDCETTRPPLIQVLNLLLSEGISPDVPDYRGNSPLHYATMKLSEPVAFTLLCYGARPDLVNIDGDTPLMLVDLTTHTGQRIARLLAENGTSLYALILMDIGANPEMRNKYDWCLLDGPGLSRSTANQLKHGAIRCQERQISLFGPTKAPMSAISALERNELGLGRMRVVWIPDENTARCVKCNAAFTVLRRRHHCRRCGSIFCSSCCHHKADLRDMGYVCGPTRVCIDCYAAIREPSTIEGGSARMRLPSEFLFLHDEHVAPPRSREASTLLGTSDIAVPSSNHVDMGGWDPEASTPQRVAALEMEWEDALVAGISGGRNHDAADTTVERVVFHEAAFNVNRSFTM